jgi:hypothetical protein
VPGEAAAPAPQAQDVAARRRRRQDEAAEQRRRNEAAARVAQLQTQELEIRDLLALADSQYQSGALWQPAGISAADSYRAILAMRPDQPDALAGARRIAGVLVTEAGYAQSAGDTVSATALLHEISTLAPALPQLASLQARLSSSPAEVSARERRQLARAAVSIALAREMLDGAKDTNAATAATAEYDKAVAANAHAPGLALLRERLSSAYVAAVRGAIGSGDPATATWLLQKARDHGFLNPDLEQLEAAADP